MQRTTLAPLAACSGSTACSRPTRAAACSPACAPTRAATLRHRPVGLPALRPLGRSSCASWLAGSCHRPVAIHASMQDSHPLMHDRATQPPTLPVLLPAPTLWRRLMGQLSRWAGVAVLAMALAFGWAGAAEAARSGGRMGGSSFGGSRYGGGLGGSRGAAWGASSSTGAWGSPGRSAFGGAGAFGGYSSSSRHGTVGSPGSSVRVNSFFLSPFGELVLLGGWCLRAAGGVGPPGAASSRTGEVSKVQSNTE